MTIDVLVSSNLHFHLLLSYGNKSSMTPLSILVKGRIWVTIQARGSWSVHGLPCVLFSKLWLGYYALVFVCLMMSLSYVLWMKKCLMTFSLESEHEFNM